MNKKPVTTVFGIALRGAITPRRVAHQVMDQLTDLVKRSIASGNIPSTILAKFEQMFSDFTEEPQDIIDRFNESEKNGKRLLEVSLRTTAVAELSFHFCLKALDADQQGKSGLAWLYVAEATALYGSAIGCNHAVSQLHESSKATAKSGGDGRSNKIEKCRLEFLNMVSQRNPPWPRTKDGVADAVLELKPKIVDYARSNQNSIITANTDLPKKWLLDHWGLKKRAYRKSTAKQN